MPRYGLRNHSGLAEIYLIRKGIERFMGAALYAGCEHNECLAWQAWWMDEGYDEVPQGLERWASLRAFWRYLRSQGMLSGHVCPTTKEFSWSPSPPPLVKIVPLLPLTLASSLPPRTTGSESSTSADSCERPRN